MASRPGKFRSLVEIEPLIHTLYVDQQLSCHGVVSELKRLGYDYTLGVVGPFIKSLGVGRDVKTATRIGMQRVHYAEKPCRFCKQTFSPTSSRDSVCRTCVPDDIPVKRSRLLCYGITYAQYLDLLERQQHRCGICGRHLKGLSSKEVHIDHCHTTNVVRGVLCITCNSHLAAIEDVTWRERAETYLQQVPSGASTC